MPVTPLFVFTISVTPWRVCCSSKTPPHVVQRIARHADLDVTLGIYAHTNFDAMREALDKIEWDGLRAVVATGLLHFAEKTIIN